MNNSTPKERDPSAERSTPRPVSAIVSSSTPASSPSHSSHPHSLLPPHHAAGPLLPIRHTRRTSEQAHKFDPPPAPPKPPEMTEQSLRAHYEPLLLARETKLNEMKQRFRKQESRLHTMQAWKGRAMDQANLEPNVLDFVLGPDGTFVESLRVRQKRLILERTAIRHFLRTQRLLRSLKIIHRHLQTMLPLLLESPNSRISPTTRHRLEELLRSWGKEIIHTIAQTSPNKRTNNEFNQTSGDSDLNRNDSSNNSAPNPSRDAAPDGDDSASPPFRLPTLIQHSAPGPSKADRTFYRAHPHAHMNKLLANLFDVVPLLRSGVTETLNAQREIDRDCSQEFVRDTTIVQQLEHYRQRIEIRKEEIQKLQSDTELLECEIRDLRMKYSSKVDTLESTIRQEQILLRKLNHLYYKEVADKLGEPYAVQLSIVQQGHPFNHVVPSPPSVGGIPLSTPTPFSQQAPTTSSSMPSTPSHLFIPSTMNGLSLPPPPKVFPEFLHDTANSGNDTSSIPPVQSLPVTPNNPLTGNRIHRVPIDRSATLKRIDDLFNSHPRRENVIRQQAQMKEHSSRQQQQQQLQRERRNTATTSAAISSRSSVSSSVNEPDLEPFFIMNSPHQHENGDNHDASAVADINHELDDLDPLTDSDDQIDEDTFKFQRLHFKKGVVPNPSPASFSSNREESKETSTSAPSSRSSAPPTVDPFLAVVHPPPSAPLTPLHVRSISEIDWNADGPIDVDALKEKMEQIALQANKRNENSRALRNATIPMPALKNPFVLFPKYDPANQDLSNPVDEDDDDSQSSPSSPNPGRSSISSFSSSLWSRKPPPESHPKSSPAHSRHSTATSTLSLSPVPGMSMEVYQQSYQAGVSALLKLGYTADEALQFAPHLVLTGVIQAPSVKSAPSNNNANTYTPAMRVHPPRPAFSATKRRYQSKRALHPANHTPVSAAYSPQSNDNPADEIPPQTTVSDELAWIDSIPSTQPYATTDESLTTNFSRPATARRINSHSYPHVAHPSHSPLTGQPAPLMASPAPPRRPKSAVLTRSGKNERTRHSDTLAQSRARTTALYYGLPVSVVSYRPPTNGDGSTSGMKSVKPRPPSASPSVSRAFISASTPSTTRRIEFPAGSASRTTESDETFLLSPTSA